MTANVNLEIRAGADYRHDFFIYESEDDSLPRDLTSDDLHAEFRINENDKNAIISLDLSDGLAILDPLAGHVRMTITRDKTEDLRFREESIDGTYDMELTDASGFPRSSAVEGSFTIRRDKTRSNNGVAP